MALVRPAGLEPTTPRLGISTPLPEYHYFSRCGLGVYLSSSGIAMARRELGCFPRPAGLLLAHCRSVNSIPVRCDILHLEAHHVTTPQLAIDCQVEERQIPDPPSELQPCPNGPNMPRLQCRFSPCEFVLVPGFALVQLVILLDRLRRHPNNGRKWVHKLEPVVDPTQTFGRRDFSRSGASYTDVSFIRKMHLARYQPTFLAAISIEPVSRGYSTIRSAGKRTVTMVPTPTLLCKSR